MAVFPFSGGRSTLLGPKLSERSPRDEQPSPFTYTSHKTQSPISGWLSCCLYWIAMNEWSTMNVSQALILKTNGASFHSF